MRNCAEVNCKTRRDKVGVTENNIKIDIIETEYEGMKWIYLAQTRPNIGLL
jgi:hypothetical protein